MTAYQEENRHNTEKMSLDQLEANVRELRAILEHNAGMVRPSEALELDALWLRIRGIAYDRDKELHYLPHRRTP
jgi:hypothetical protein